MASTESFTVSAPTLGTVTNAIISAAGLGTRFLFVTTVTGALQECAASSAPGGGVHVVIFSGRRCNTGDRLDYVKAVVRLAVDFREFGSNFSSWLTGFVAKWDSAARELAAR